ncbi:MAG: hypothetical protein ACMUIE_07740 [Thermoplasmatota archaeon]
MKDAVNRMAMSGELPFNREGRPCEERKRMSSAKEIGEMRTALSVLGREHPELEEFVEEMNEDLWAIEIALEINDDAEGGEEDDEA